MRIATGEEVLVARVLAEDGHVGYGFSFRLDATEARHMAMWNARLAERSGLEAVLDHPWERAFSERRPIPWECEPGFAKLRWLP